MEILKHVRIVSVLLTVIFATGCTQGSFSAKDSMDTFLSSQQTSPKDYHSYTTSQGGFGPGSSLDSTPEPQEPLHYTWYRIDPVLGPMAYTVASIWITSHGYCDATTVGTVIELKNLLVGPGLDRLVCAKSTEKYLATTMIKETPSVVYNGYFLESTILPDTIACSPKMGQTCNACFGGNCQDGIQVCSGGCGSRSALLGLPAELLGPNKIK